MRPCLIELLNELRRRQIDLGRPDTLRVRAWALIIGQYAQGDGDNPRCFG